MTAPSPPTAADYLKYVAGEGCELLKFIRSRLDADTAAAEAVDRVGTILRDSAARFCTEPDEMNTYSSGRKVSSSLKLEPGAEFVYHWHPDPQHPENAPKTLFDRHRFPSGAIRSVVISSDQLLDVVTHQPGIGPQ